MVVHLQLSCVASGHLLDLLAMELRAVLYFIAAWAQLLLVFHDLTDECHVGCCRLLLESGRRFPLELAIVLVGGWHILPLQCLLYQEADSLRACL